MFFSQAMERSGWRRADGILTLLGWLVYTASLYRVGWNICQIIHGTCEDLGDWFTDLGGKGRLFKAEGNIYRAFYRLRHRPFLVYHEWNVDCVLLLYRFDVSSGNIILRPKAAGIVVGFCCQNWNVCIWVDLPVHVLATTSSQGSLNLCILNRWTKGSVPLNEEIL